MSTDATPPINNGAAQGLPTVKPPSARFIVQLFLIPGLIVFGLVLVFVFGGLSWVGTSSPEGFLNRLDNPNPDVRWRAAHELAQVLKRPESLEMASDPDFALDIAERLEKAVEELEKSEKSTQEQLDGEFKQIHELNLSSEETQKRKDEAANVAWRKLRPQRDLVAFLINCTGDFVVPVGADILARIAQKREGAEPKSLSLRRRRAVWALANLGANVQIRYFGNGATAETKALADPQKKLVLLKLEKVARTGGTRANMANIATMILTGSSANVDGALAVCARDEDVFLRAEVALTLTFWNGPQVEPTLLLLSQDDGHGKRIEIIDWD